MSPTISSAVKAATTVAGKAAPKAADAGASTPGGLSTSGIVGLSAGAAGVGLTLFDAWKDSMGKGFDASSLINPSSVAIAGGALLLTAGEKSKAAPDALMRNGLRGSGVALMLGGLAGALIGAIHTTGNPLAGTFGAAGSTQTQRPVGFEKTLPPAAANLEGIEVATANVINASHDLVEVPVYVDPTTAEQLPEGTKLGEAIGQARAATQADSLDRSHAVVKTDDGTLWTLRLAGDLDQVDGRYFTKDNKFDARYEPEIGRRQQAIQAIAGVEGSYVFPEGTGATAPVQYAGDIPWVTPELPDEPAKPETPAPAPAPAATPTTADKPADTTPED